MELDKMTEMRQSKIRKLNWEQGKFKGCNW